MARLSRRNIGATIRTLIATTVMAILAISIERPTTMATMMELSMARSIDAKDTDTTTVKPAIIKMLQMATAAKWVTRTLTRTHIVKAFGAAMTRDTGAGIAMTEDTIHTIGMIPTPAITPIGMSAMTRTTEHGDGATTATTDGMAMTSTR